MAFGFFDWLRMRTRDAILSGASEAGRALEQGTAALTERTEAVMTFDHQLQATTPGAVTPPERTAALPTTPPASQRGQEPKQVPQPRRTRETPRTLTPKTQALLDARPGTDF